MCVVKDGYDNQMSFDDLAIHGFGRKTLHAYCTKQKNTNFPRVAT